MFHSTLPLVVPPVASLEKVRATGYRLFCLYAGNIQKTDKRVSNFITHIPYLFALCMCDWRYLYNKSGGGWSLNTYMLSIKGNN